MQTAANLFALIMIIFLHESLMDQLTKSFLSVEVIAKGGKSNNTFYDKLVTVIKR